MRERERGVAVGSNWRYCDCYYQRCFIYESLPKGTSSGINFFISSNGRALLASISTMSSISAIPRCFECSASS
jgi:hypothetical protein